MQDQNISIGAGCVLEGARLAVLALLLRPEPPGIYSMEEISAVLGDPEEASLAVADLERLGLAHRGRGLVLASWAAWETLLALAGRL